MSNVGVRSRRQATVCQTRRVDEDDNLAFILFDSCEAAPVVGRPGGIALANVAIQVPSLPLVTILALMLLVLVYSELRQRTA